MIGLCCWFMFLKMRLLHLLGGNGSLSDGDGGRGGSGGFVVIVVVGVGAPHRGQA